MQSSFADFVPTRGSRLALASVRALLARGAGGRLVLLHGPPGVGKSHLLRAARLQHGETSRDFAVADLIREVLTDGPVRTDERLLTADDLHVLAGMPRSQLELGRRLEERVGAGVRVLAAAGELAELPELTDRLTRIDAAVIVALRPPTSREMAQLLLLEASRAGLRLDVKVAAGMARRCRGDVRLAQGAMARLRLAIPPDGP